MSAVIDRNIGVRWAGSGFGDKGGFATEQRSMMRVLVFLLSLVEWGLLDRDWVGLLGHRLVVRCVFRRVRRLV